MGEDKHEEQDSEESRKDDTEKEDVFDESLENAYGVEVVQEATTSSYCEKCEVNFKNKKSFRRHLIKGHKTNACGSCDDIFYTRTESKVHVHKLHEGDDNNEVKKRETIEIDITHEKKSKNDETEVESNGKRIKRPIEILMGGLNMISITQT